MSKVSRKMPIDHGIGDNQDLLFGELNELLGYCVRRAQGGMHRDFVASMAGIDLTQKQCATLWLISENAGISQVSIAASLDMDRATMMSVVDRLEDRGLVIRKRSTDDRRRQELYLTPAGQATLKKAKGRIAVHEQRFTSRFKPAELAALKAALRKLSGDR